EALLLPHPVDRLVGHVGEEMIVRVVGELDVGQPVVERRSPLVGLTADEAVEFVEPRTGRPLVGWARWADLPRRYLMALAESGRAVAVQAEDLGERRDSPGPHAGIPGIGRRDVHDGAGVAGMMIAPGEQRRSGRRAEGRDVESVV